MTIFRRFPLRRVVWGIGLVLALNALVSGIVSAQVARPPLSSYPNFDLRNPAKRSDPAVAATFEKYHAQAAARGTSAMQSATTVVSSMRDAQSALSRELPHARVGINPLTNAIETVGTQTPGTFLRAASGAPNEEVARSFLSDHASLYGVAPEQVADLITIADYANPAGNMAWVEFRQEFNGIPVFQGQIRFGFGAEGHLMGTTGNLATGIDAKALVTTPGMAAADAAVAAASSIGYTLDASRFTTKSTSSNGQRQTLIAGPFSRAVTTELYYFALENGVATLAYSFVFWDEVDAYAILVDANDGTLLWRKNITVHQTQTATYGIYDRGSPAPLAPTNILPGSGTQAAGVARTTVTLIGNEPPNTFNNLGWITDGTNITSGNNVHAGVDLSAPDGIDTGGEASGSPSRVFNFTYSPPPLGTQAPTLAAYKSGAITNVFYWSNYHHDQMYRLGFTEQAGNFQNDNFGRGGQAGDAISAEVHDYSGTNNSNFSTWTDGSFSRMQLYLFTGPNPDRDAALDADIVLHEMTHGTSLRLHGNGSGLSYTESSGMGEGWSDFFARCMLSTASEDVNGVFTSGAYSTYLYNGTFTSNYYYGVRRFPYAVKSNVGANGKPHNPLTYGDIDPGQVDLSDGAYPPGALGSSDPQEAHNIGEVWCMMLLEMRARMITRLGWAAGNQRAMQIAIDAMKLEYAEPTILSGRDALVSADVAGYSGEDVADIRSAFAIRGAGAQAYETGTTILESYFPAEVPQPISFSDALGNNNGIAEPGEFLIFTVPLLNRLTTSNSDGPVFVTLNGVTVGYGSILSYIDTPVVRNFIYRVPPNAVCGSLLTIPITISSPMGVATTNFYLRVGVPSLTSIAAQSFDGVTPPALPAGWTTTTTGPANTAWTSVSSPSIDTGNCVYTPETNVLSDAALVSPSIAINADSVLLSFKHQFNFSAYQTIAGNGGVLEIKIGGGAFVDIVSAGGRFAQGGYNNVVQGNHNPLYGRRCWGGAQATTLTTIVELPPGVKGSTVQFRWRVGCGAAFSVSGSWYIDSFAVSSAVYQCPVLDTDGDGIPDAYETSHGMNPFDPADANLDSDGDGQTNLQEYLAGTNPNDANSVLRISGIADEYGAMGISFPTVLGTTYQVEYCDSLDGTWTTLQGGIVGTGDVVKVYDVSGAAQRFFRVRSP